MTIAEMKAHLAELERESVARLARSIEIDTAKARLKLAIEEAEGRPDSHDARFSRAYLAGDHEAMQQIIAEPRSAEEFSAPTYPDCPF